MLQQDGNRLSYQRRETIPHCKYKIRIPCLHPKTLLLRAGILLCKYRVQGVSLQKLKSSG
jgi:hypothetical protein